MIQDIEKFIKSLKRRKTVTNLSVYSPQEEERDFFFYYAILGFLKNEYFAVTIFNTNAKNIVKINNTTDCKEEIAKIMEKFNLTETEK